MRDRFVDSVAFKAFSTFVALIVIVTTSDTLLGLAALGIILIGLVDIPVTVRLRQEYPW